MNILNFDTHRGLYLFDLTELETELHSHPAIEIIVASTGNFSFSTAEHHYEKVTFAVVDRNVAHKISINANSSVRMAMIEYHDLLVIGKLSVNGFLLDNGHCCQTDVSNHLKLLTDLVSILADAEMMQNYDSRVIDVILLMGSNNIEYKQMMHLITQAVGLSESRISHLFKVNVGVSLKRYLIWNKLKLTIKNHLSKEEDLFASLYRAGFYDQPHFIRSFKAMLGISPAKAYNSRMLQS